MSDVAKARKAAMNLAKTFKNVIEVGEYLEKVENFDNLEKEAKARAEAAEEAASAAKNWLVSVVEEKDKLEGELEDLKTRADQIIKEAQDTAIAERKSAKDAIRNASEKAKAEAQAVVNEWAGRINQAKNEYNEVVRKRAQAQDKVDEL